VDYEIVFVRLVVVVVYWGFDEVDLRVQVELVCEDFFLESGLFLFFCKPVERRGAECVPFLVEFWCFSVCGCWPVS